MVLALLQARMSSSRLPGKVMRPLLGEPMIARQVERLRRARQVDELAVATSDRPDDDELAAFCAKLGLRVFRGSLTDVLDRFQGAARAFGPTDAIVRLTADCPLADWTVLDEVIGAHRQGGFDYTNNTSQRTFPHGLDVEVMRPQVLEAAWREAADPYEREHVTPFIYRHPERFALGCVTAKDPHPELRWTVDLPADFDFVQQAYAALYPANPAFTSADVVALPRNSAPVPD